MAAKYQAMVRAAEDAARRPPRAARPGPRRPPRPAAPPGRAAKARVACAAALLRWICYMTVHDAGWDPVAASGGRLAPAPLPEAA